MVEKLQEAEAIIHAMAKQQIKREILIGSLWGGARKGKQT